MNTYFLEWQLVKLEETKIREQRVLMLSGNTNIETLSLVFLGYTIHDLAFTMEVSQQYIYVQKTSQV